MDEKNYKILVVDDEQDLCEILKFNLETEGYQVETANSAEEALEKDIASYDLLLLDVMMVGSASLPNLSAVRRMTALTRTITSRIEKGLEI